MPLPDGNGLLTVLDVTDSKKAEDALRERNAALEEADAVKTRFLANMSYEFRTPLTSIGGFAELLQSGVAGELTDAGAGLCRGDPDLGRAARRADRDRARPDAERGRAAAARDARRSSCCRSSPQVVREREERDREQAA